MCSLIIFALFLLLVFSSALSSGFIWVLLGIGAFLFIGSLLLNRKEPTELEKAQMAADDVDTKYRKQLVAEEFHRQAFEAGARTEEEIKVFAKHIGTDPALALQMFQEAESADTKLALESYAKEKDAATQRLNYAKRAAELAKLRQKDRDIAQKELEAADIHGIEKYLTEVKSMLEKHDSFDSLEEMSRQTFIADSRASANTHDPYAWGGMVDGLLGPGAGLATALQTMEENAVEEERAAYRREHALDGHVETLSAIRKIRGNITPRSVLEQTVRKMETHIVDEDHASDYMDKLAFTEVDYEVSAGGSLNVKLRVTGPDTIQLLGKPALIDGSVTVTAYVGGAQVATGHLSAPGTGVTDLSGSEPVGFCGRSDSDAVEAWVMLAPHQDTFFFDEVDDYQLEFSPYHIWSIQL